MSYESGSWTKIESEYELIEYETSMDKIIVNRGPYTNGSSIVNNHGFTKIIT